MIIYKCKLTGDEMFSDIYKIKETDDGMFYEVDGKNVTRSDDIDESKFGANASAEEGCDELSASSVSGVDIVLNHKLQTTAFDKKTYQLYIKDFMKAIKAKLEEETPDRVEGFQKGAPAAVKKILGNFKNYEFYTGESMNPDGHVGLLDYREDGVTPYMVFFKDALELEKC